MKPAKDAWFGGWRRRWVVLSKGTLTYINPKHPHDADLKRRIKLHAARVSEKLHLGCDPPTLHKDDGIDDTLLKENATFNLQLSTTKADGDPSDSTSRDVRFCFRIVSPTHSLVLQAESYEERAEWMRAIQVAIADNIVSSAPDLRSAYSTGSAVGDKIGDKVGDQVGVDVGVDVGVVAGGGKPTSTTAAPPPRSTPPDVSTPPALEPALPVGWEAYSDREGNAYYHCAATGETTYTHPAQPADSVPPAPPDLNEAISGEGAPDGAPTLTPPPLLPSGSSLPAGWEAHTDDAAMTFYYHPATGQSTYEHPAGGGTTVAAAPPPSVQAASAATTRAEGGGGVPDCASPPAAKLRARVLYSFEASGAGELSLSEGQVVTV